MYQVFTKMVKTFLRFLQNYLLPLVVDEVEALGAVVSEAGRVTNCRKPFLWKEFWCIKIKHHICNDRVIVLSECSEELPIRIVLGSWRMVFEVLVQWRCEYY